MKNKALLRLALLTFVTASAVFAPRVFAQSPTLDKLTLTAKKSGNQNYYEVRSASNKISGAVVIPGTYQNVPVTQIPIGAFRGCSNMTSITIPASVTTIANQAFQTCTNLTSITFGGNNTSISGNDPFGSTTQHDLKAKYGAGGAGTYTRSAGGSVWTKQGAASAPAPTPAPAANTSLDGWWMADSGLTIVVSGDTAIILYIGSSPVWQDAFKKGYFKEHDEKLRNIRNTGNLTWTMQELGVDYNPRTNEATGTKWGNTTLTMSANGQTLSENGSVRWTSIVPHQ